MEDLLEPGEDVELDDQGIEDIDFDRRTVAALYFSGFHDTNPERWFRANEDIRIDDLVLRLTGFSSSVISCPFHGRDSTPSFRIYRGNNHAFCYGCPPGKQYYDPVIFTAEKLGISRLAALQWLEREWHLPPIADLKPGELEALQAEEPLTATFRDLLPAFLDHARKDIQTAKDPDLAKEYLEILFGAWPNRTEEKTNPNAGDPLPLARVLGKTVVHYILQSKAR